MKYFMNENEWKYFAYYATLPVCCIVSTNLEEMSLESQVQ